MTPRRRAILIVVLALLLIAIIVAVILMLVRAVPQEEAPAAPIESPVIEEPTAAALENFENPLIIRQPEAVGNTAGRQMAELFAERYGSYSNQGDYQNLRDLLPVMTARYRQETEDFLETGAASGQAYEGVTSVKVSTEVRSSDADSAIIAVTLQQQRSSGGVSTVGYRTLRMELDLVGKDWRIDKAAWEN